MRSGVQFSLSLQGKALARSAKGFFVLKPLSLLIRRKNKKALRNPPTGGLQGFALLSTPQRIAEGNSPLQRISGLCLVKLRGFFYLAFVSDLMINEWDDYINPGKS